ncbi:unnamed protein product [Bemisia tabaci]|uniref:Dihydrolipoamide acetyltransferase component of pyruvate dehydrogenase complex n=1 Tax=Bemisia tabaci TaxID=7038 RepID=A0A9P0ACH0_BEMTA|nr:unnamed protein product [Bemisia tabaci]
MLRHLRSRLRSGLSLRPAEGKARQFEAPRRSNCHPRVLTWHSHGLHTSKATAAAAVKPFILSDIGEGIKQVVITKWHVKEGDVVEEFDDVCDVESDKAATTITSKFKGVVKKVHYDVDATAQVGAPLVDIEVQSEDAEPLVEKAVQSESTQVAPSGAGAEEMPLATPVAGSSGEEEKRAGERPLATPAVRRLLRENQLSLQEVRGSGKGGRVLKEDVLSFIDNNKVNRQRDETESHYEQLRQTQAQAAGGEGAGAGNQDVVFRVEGLTKHMVRSMTASSAIPTMTFGDEVNVTTLVQWREQFRETLAKRDVKLTFLPFMMKAMSLAILKYPIVNASLDEKCERITYKSAHNIGFAVATARGLVVPNVKNVRNLSILQIAVELARLQNLAHAGRLTPFDISGGTITISNIGSVGGIYFRPLINPPEVVIGATGKLQTLPRYNKNGELEKTQIINISWAADHRIVDGATLALFSNTWKEYLENPSALLLGLV